MAELTAAGSQRVSAIRRWPALRHFGVGGLALAGGYAAATLGYLLVVRPAGVVFLWPPAGLVLAALVLADRRYWPAIIAGTFAGNVLVDLNHTPFTSLALAGSAVNSLEQLIGATIFRRIGGRRMRFAALADIGALFGASVIANGFTALLGANVLQHYSNTTIWRGWYTWWVGDGMGMLILTPAVLTWAHLVRDGARGKPTRAVETMFVVTAIMVIAGTLLAMSPDEGHVLGDSAYLVVPLLIWAGVRSGPAGAATASVALTAVTAWFVVRGSVSPSASATQTAQVLEVYTFLGLAAISALIPAAILEQHDEAARGLQESDERFRQIADNIKEVFFIIDLATWSPAYVSPSWSLIWGRPIEDAYDPNIALESIHPDDRMTVRAAQDAAEEGDRTKLLCRIVRPDGTERWIQVRSYPVRDSKGKTYRIVAIAADVTELRATEEKFNQAQKLEAIGRLAAGVAHDFNNLLTVILAEADELATMPGLAPSGRASVAEVRRAAESAATLTRQLLTFSRQQMVVPSDFDLNEAVSDVAKMLRRLIGENVQVDVRQAPGPLGVHADRGQIEQVLANLAVNARDAMTQGGTLLVATAVVPGTGGLRSAADRDGDAGIMRAETPRPEGPPPPLGWVALTMTDTGTGMAPGVVAHAFEPFFTTKDRGRGTGLGLATCHGIVTQAGGWVEIASKVAVGTTIRVLLPRVALSEVPRGNATTAPMPRGAETVLLVEDETGVRKVTARMLRANGYTVLEARDGDDALRQLGAGAPVDLLLTDVMLPGMSGGELAERVHASRPDIKTLFASGYTDDVVIYEQMISKDAALLQKPFTAATLARRVRDLLDDLPRDA